MTNKVSPFRRKFQKRKCTSQTFFRRTVTLLFFVSSKNFAAERRTLLLFFGLWRERCCCWSWVRVEFVGWQRAVSCRTLKLSAAARLLLAGHCLLTDDNVQWLSFVPKSKGESSRVFSSIEKFRNIWMKWNFEQKLVEKQRQKDSWWVFLSNIRDYIWQKFSCQKGVELKILEKTSFSIIFIVICKVGGKSGNCLLQLKRTSESKMSKASI